MIGDTSTTIHVVCVCVCFFFGRPEVARGTLPLAAAVAVELADTGRPVLAAGGVVSGRGLLAALALGCDGVVMGTR